MAFLRRRRPAARDNPDSDTVADGPPAVGDGFPFTGSLIGFSRSLPDIAPELKPLLACFRVSYFSIVSLREDRVTWLTTTIAATAIANNTVTPTIRSPSHSMPPKPPFQSLWPAP